MFPWNNEQFCLISSDTLSCLQIVDFLKVEATNSADCLSVLPPKRRKNWSEEAIERVLSDVSNGILRIRRAAFS